MNTEYAVTGMTCDHCSAAVRAEIEAIDGVQAVEVDLTADGVSTVAVVSERALTTPEVATALDEAGGYALAGTKD